MAPGAGRLGNSGRASNVHQLPVGSRAGNAGGRRHPSDPSFNPENAQRDDYHDDPSDNDNCACSHHYDYHTPYDDKRCTYQYDVPGRTATCGCSGFRRP